MAEVAPGMLTGRQGPGERQLWQLQTGVQALHCACHSPGAACEEVSSHCSTVMVTEQGSVKRETPGLGTINNVRNNDLLQLLSTRAMSLVFHEYYSSQICVYFEH